MNCGKDKNTQRCYRTEASPTCPQHKVVMVVYSLREQIRYCKCPVPDCQCRSKQLRRDVRI